MFRRLVATWLCHLECAVALIVIIVIVIIIIVIIINIGGSSTISIIIVIIINIHSAACCLQVRICRFSVRVTLLSSAATDRGEGGGFLRWDRDGGYTPARAPPHSCSSLPFP